MQPTKGVYIQQKIIIFAFILLIFSLLLFSFSWIRGYENVLNWDILSELGEIPFKYSVHQQPLPATAYIVSEQFVASMMAINVWASIFFLMVFVVASALLLAVISSWNTFNFTLGIGLFMFVVASLKIELLFDTTGWLPTASVLLVFGATGFYFNAFAQKTTTFLRWLIFLILWLLLLSLCSAWGNTTKLVVLHFSTYGIVAASIATLCFMAMVAHQIIYGCLVLATSTKSSYSLTHFSVLTVVYWLNLILVHLHNTKQIDWNILYISPFVVLLFSLAIGLWQLIISPNTSGAFPFSGNTQQALLYTALASIACATLGYYFATANDPLVEVAEDAIIYTHLAMGISFFFYVFFNFAPLFHNAQAIYKVVYQPKIIPFSTTRFIAIGLVIAALSADKYFVVFQAGAGYNNALGDLHTANQEYRLAERYYKNALGYEFQNHKANYALGSLAMLQNDDRTAGYYFRQATLKQPSVYAYAAWARILLNEDLFFDALFALREGTKYFPKSDELANNLGFLYAKAKLPDSAAIYYDKLRNNTIAQSNLLALQLTLGVETAPNYGKQSLAYTANRLAWGLLNNKPLQENFNEKILEDSTLTVPMFAYLSNAAWQLKNLPDFTKSIEKWQQKSENQSFEEDLSFAYLLQQYANGSKMKALEIVQNKIITADTIQAKKYKKWYNALLNQEKTVAFLGIFPATEPEVVAVIQKYPLNEVVLSKAVTFFNQQHTPQKGYDVLQNALQFRPDSPGILKLYALQSLSIGMSHYGQQAIGDLFSVLSPADYQTFLSTYQAKKALMEKQAQSFR